MSGRAFLSCLVFSLSLLGCSRVVGGGKVVVLRRGKEGRKGQLVCLALDEKTSWGEGRKGRAFFSRECGIIYLVHTLYATALQAAHLLATMLSNEFK